MVVKTIIAIHGLKESGKSTLANALYGYMGSPIMSFASPIKAMLTVLYKEAGLSEEDINRALHTDKKAPLPYPLGGNGRVLAQTLGTEWGRELVSETLWSDILLNKINKLPNTRFVIDDLRFPSEFHSLRKSSHNLLLVKLHRPHVITEADFHASEQGLPDHLFDLVVENDFDTVQDYVDYAVPLIMQGVQPPT